MAEPIGSQAQDVDLRVFSYAIADKAPLYLDVVEALTAARERFRLQLRPNEVVRELHQAGLEQTVDEVSLALEQLVDWGNVAHFYDSAAPETLAEFYGKRFLYQLTPAGWAAHEGVRAVQRTGLAESGRLSGVLLQAIVERLEALRAASHAVPLDGARLYVLCIDTFNVFAELAANSARYMSDLAEQVSDVAGTDERFLAYKRAVFAYLNDFIARFTDTLPRIQALVATLDSDIEPILRAAAASDEAPTLQGADEGPLVGLRTRWSGVVGWFLADGDRAPVADSLRLAMLDALNRILLAVDRLNERHLRRASREADFVQLARWFADLGVAAPDHDQAHRLWDQAFGLWGARHFTQLAGDEEIERRRSFWEAEPVDVAPRLRATGRKAVVGRPGTGADYRATKLAKVAALRAARAQAAGALGRLAARTPARLSDLGILDRHEFGQFLALVDAALTSRPAADASRRAVTPLVTVILRPVTPAAWVSVRTTTGVLHCLDHTLAVSFMALGAEEATG
ncbi:MAG TPA: TIGR02677 family protein [Actinomycetota bacterium]|nr:TIGR02677 family protein [Actinomycetota bacterium]